MTVPANLRRRAAILALVAVPVAGLLAGCSGSSDKDPEADKSSAAAEPNYLEVPAGVELTPQGSELAVGDRGAVAWQASAEDIVALDLTVTKLEEVSLNRFASWKLDAESKKSRPYFVHAQVKNVGAGNVGGFTLPLYLVDSKDNYVTASSFQSEFKPCPSGPILPKKFKPGSKTELCLVYLAPEKRELTAVSFYPGPGFAPITWAGDVQKPTGKKSGKGDSKK
jgi:hypothetical protein